VINFNADLFRIERGKEIFGIFISVLFISLRGYQGVQMFSVMAITFKKAFASEPEV
jgi:hypothetical protein